MSFFLSLVLSMFIVSGIPIPLSPISRVILFSCEWMRIFMVPFWSWGNAYLIMFVTISLMINPKGIAVSIPRFISSNSVSNWILLGFIS